MGAIKYGLVALLLLAGVSFFYAGMGTDIPLVQFSGITTYGAPLGIALIVLAVVAAGAWREGPSSIARG